MATAVTIIHVTTDELVCDEADVQVYIDVLNGVIARMQTGFYHSPWRNEMILDAYVSAYMLGLDIMDVLNLVGIDDLEDEEDDDHVEDRISRMSNYEDRFDWSYMFDPAFYQNLGCQIRKRLEEDPLNHADDRLSEYCRHMSVKCVLD